MTQIEIQKGRTDMTKDTFETKDRYLVNRRAAFHKADFVDYHKRLPTERATIATELVQSFGMIVTEAAINIVGQRPLLTPDEVVERAVTIADKLCTEMEVRDWYDPMPSLADRFDVPKDEEATPGAKDD